MGIAQKKGMCNMKSTTIPLPFELISHIAHLLYDEGYSVSACMLTCRMWRDACRGYIYRSISMSTHQRYQELLSLLEAEPTVGNFVFELSIELIQPLPLSPTEVRHWLRVVPATLSTRLRNVSVLHLRHIRFNKVDQDPTLLSCYLAFTSLKHVKIDFCTFPTPDIGNFANGLHHLEELHVSRHWVTGRNNVDVVTPRLSLKTLTLEFTSERTSLLAIAWVKASDSLQTLQSLTLSVFTPEVAIEASDLLRNLGTTLKHLDLIPPPNSIGSSGMHICSQYISRYAESTNTNQK